MEPGHAHLEYAPPQPAKNWRRKLRRWGVPLLALAAVTWAAVRFGPPVARNWELLRHQRAAVRYVARPDEVICTSRYGVQPGSDGYSWTGYGRTSRDPEWWWRFIAAVPVPASPVAYLGEHRNRNGRRLVVINGLIFSRWPASVSTRPATAPPPVPDHELGLSAYVLRPGSLTAPPAVLRSGSPFTTTVSPADFSTTLSPADTAAQLFAGRPDPNDASRFTIEYQHGQTRGVIDGRLRDDDTVELTLRSAPTTAPQ